MICYKGDKSDDRLVLRKSDVKIFYRIKPVFCQLFILANVLLL